MEISDEQRKEIEAKLAKMSPEELQQLQAQQCIFCQIAQGKIPAKTIYEDEHLKVVLDINPASPGHCLILPKQHYMVLPQVPQELVEHMFKITKQVSHTLLRSLKVDGTSWFVANGQLAGQRAQHVMVHVIPRIDNDGIGLMIPKNDLSDDEKTTLKKLVGPVIASALGKEEVPKLESKEEKKNLPVSKEQPSTSETASSPNSTNEVNATDATQQETTEAQEQPAEPEPEQQQPSDGGRTGSIEDQETEEKNESETDDEPETEMGDRGEDQTDEETDEQPATDTDEEREDDDSEEDDHDKQSGKPNLDDITRFLSK